MIHEVKEWQCLCNSHNYVILESIEDQVRPKLNRVKVGNIAIFNCYSLGRVYWNFNNHSLLPNHRLFNNGRILAILNAQFKDAGEYQCYDESHTPPTYITSGRLQVLGKSKHKSTPKISVNFSQ